VGQFEVLGWLIKQRKLSPKREFTSDEIQKGMKEDGLEYCVGSVRRCLFPLCTLKYIETTLIRKGFGVARRYRASKKAVDEELK